MKHYFDNSATTIVCQSAIESAIKVMGQTYGNPSSLHLMGIEAEMIIKSAKESIASVINAIPEEIYFTSGGTEGNNLALFGASNAKRRSGNHIITSAFEHHSVINPLRQLSKQGFEITEVSFDKDKNLDIEKISECVTDKTIMASFMLVNNEIGTILPIKEAVRSIRRKNKNVLIHCDAVQAFMKIPINVRALDVDILTVSGHKVHAPKGIGAVYIKKGVRLTPLLYGGGQQNGIRPGTESVPLIAAIDAVCRESGSLIKENHEYVSGLNRLLREKLLGNKRITVNSPDDAIPYILNISIHNIRSEIMLHYLEKHDVFVSSGSACSKGEKSHVLKAIGMSDKDIDSALRISFSKYNTKEDVDILLDAIEKGIDSLAQNKRH